VCSMETKRFNEEVAKLPSSAVILTISMDLPFAQTRFCESEKVDRIRVLSDSVKRDFGPKYGVLIKQNGLLARSIFVVGKDGRITYEQIVPELSSQPDYAAALEALRHAAE
jgi:thioredoxin-dependent peroxiredoxin